MHTVLERGRDAHRNPCAHSYCVPAPPHAEKYPRLPHYACISMHFYVFLLQLWMSLCINRTTQSSLFSAYYPLLFQHYFSIMHCISLCISNDCEASQSHPYDQKSKPITATKEVKPFYYAYSNQTSETFSVSIVYLHFCCSGLLLDCSGLLLGTVVACFLLESDQRMPSRGFRIPSSGFRMPSRVQNAIFRRFSGTSAGPPCRHEASVTESQKRN